MKKKKEKKKEQKVRDTKIENNIKIMELLLFNFSNFF